MKRFKVVILSLLLALFVLPNGALAANGESVPATVEGMQGIIPPAGTTATDSGNYSNYTASKAIDGDLTTWWNSSAYSASIQLTFPKPLNLNQVQLAANATPISNVSYTIFGLTNGSWKQISETKIFKVINATGPTSILDPITVQPGLYGGIKISASSTTTQIGIEEVTIVTFDTSNLQATAGDSQVKLQWDKVESAESYVVHYGTAPGNYTETAAATKDEYGNFVIPGLTNGTTYYFVVSAVVGGVESSYSNEASATPQAPVQDPDPTPSGERAILVITMINGLEKEYDLPMSDVTKFLNWYDAKDAGTGPAKYAISKYSNNKGPFASRTDYVIFNNILTFEVNAYNE